MSQPTPLSPLAAGSIPEIIPMESNIRGTTLPPPPTNTTATTRRIPPTYVFLSPLPGFDQKLLSSLRSFHRALEHWATTPSSTITDHLTSSHPTMAALSPLQRSTINSLAVNMKTNRLLREVLLDFLKVDNDDKAAVKTAAKQMLKFVAAFEHPPANYQDASIEYMVAVEEWMKRGTKIAAPAAAPAPEPTKVAEPEPAPKPTKVAKPAAAPPAEASTSSDGTPPSSSPEEGGNRVLGLAEGAVIPDSQEEGSSDTLSVIEVDVAGRRLEDAEKDKGKEKKKAPPKKGGAKRKSAEKENGGEEEPSRRSKRERKASK